MSLIAAIAFDPTIRGVLVIMVAVGALFGSVYLIVATDTGIRNGFLIAMAALTGWCFSLGLLWTVYGIGMVGQSPTWVAKEINFDRNSELVTEHANNLPDTDIRTTSLESPEELLLGFEEDNPEVRKNIEATEGEGFVPESLTEVVTLVPQIKEQVDPQLGGWRILSESDSRRGETVASADAALAANAVFGSSTTSSDYTTHDVFFYGGKSGAEPETVPGSRGLLQQAWHRIETTLELKNPALYGAVTIQRNITQPVAPGEAPPPAQVDDTAGSITVVMERNLGNKRVIPALFTFFTGLLFVVFCSMLHTRDKRAMAMRAAWDPKAS